MKQVIYLLLFVVLPMIVAAQNKEGLVLYTSTAQFKMSLPDDAPEEMKNMVPPVQSSQQVLLFNEQEILYRDLNDDEKDIDIKHDDGDGGAIQIKMVRPKNILYRNLETDKVIESREFMGRTFLVKDDVKALKWKLSPDKKTVLKYSCQKATLVDSTKTVVAWFTSEIPLPAGPETFNGLPGLILELDMDNGARTFIADKVEFKSLEKNAIKAPTKGKDCTRAEFDKIVADKMKEMGAENGGGGMKVIIRDKN
jgi:GLPGLI family protein